VSTPTPRILAFALLLTLPTLTGCLTRWQPIEQPLPEGVMTHPRGGVRVEFTDGTTLEADSVAAAADTLVVWNKDLITRHPFTAIGSIARSQPNLAAAGAWLVGGALAVYFLTKDYCDQITGGWGCH